MVKSAVGVREKVISGAGIQGAPEAGGGCQWRSGTCSKECVGVRWVRQVGFTVANFITVIRFITVRKFITVRRFVTGMTFITVIKMDVA